MRRFGAGLARHERPDIAAVDEAVLRRLGAGQTGKCRQDVDRRGQLAAYRARGNLAGPAGERGLQVAAVPGRAFALAERPGAAGVIAIREPRAVVGAEED